MVVTQRVLVPGDTNPKDATAKDIVSELLPWVSYRVHFTLFTCNIISSFIDCKACCLLLLKTAGTISSKTHFKDTSKKKEKYSCEDEAARESI